MIPDKPGETFASILFRHMDRLSFMLQNLLYESGSGGANVFSEDKIKTFYLNLLHLEALLYPHIKPKDTEVIEPIKDHLFKKRNYIRKDPISYFIKCQEFFRALNVVSHNSGFTNITKSVDAFDEDEDAEED